MFRFALLLPLANAATWNGFEYDPSKRDENPCATAYSSIALKCPDGSVEPLVFRDPNATPMCDFPACVEGIGTVDLPPAVADCTDLKAILQRGPVSWIATNEDSQMRDADFGAGAGDYSSEYNYWGENSCSYFNLDSFEEIDEEYYNSGSNYGTYGLKNQLLDYEDYDCDDLPESTDQEILAKIACWCDAPRVGRHRSNVYVEGEADWHPYSLSQGGPGLDGHPLNGLYAKQACCVCGGGMNSQGQYYENFVVPSLSLQCTEGQYECNGACFDLQTDINHCGGCLEANMCLPGQECLAGVCMEKPVCQNGVPDRKPLHGYEEGDHFEADIDCGGECISITGARCGQGTQCEQSKSFLTEWFDTVRERHNQCAQGFICGTAENNYQQKYCIPVDQGSIEDLILHNDIHGLPAPPTSNPTTPPATDAPVPAPTIRDCSLDGASMIYCGSTCVDSYTNTLHCGGCNAPCGENQRCNAGTCEDLAAPCENAVKDNLETDTDCGGGDCGLCALTKMCGDHSDCTNHNCQNDLCTAVTSAPTDPSTTNTPTAAPPTPQATIPPTFPVSKPVYQIKFTAAQYDSTVHDGDDFKFIIQGSVARAVYDLPDNETPTTAQRNKVIITDIKEGSVKVDWYVDDSTITEATVTDRIVSNLQRNIRADFRAVAQPKFVGLTAMLVEKQSPDETETETAAPTTSESSDNLPIIIGASVGGVVLIGIVGYFLYTRLSGGSVKGQFGIGSTALSTIA